MKATKPEMPNRDCNRQTARRRSCRRFVVLYAGGCSPYRKVVRVFLCTFAPGDGYIHFGWKPGPGGRFQSDKTGTLRGLQPPNGQTPFSPMTCGASRWGLQPMPGRPPGYCTAPLVLGVAIWILYGNRDPEVGYKSTRPKILRRGCNRRAARRRFRGRLAVLHARGRSSCQEGRPSAALHFCS